MEGPSDRDARQGQGAEAEALYQSKQDFIRKAVRHVARRWWLSPDEADDFESAVHLKLVQDDYAVLRKFKRRSTPETYLTTVIQRVFLDLRIQRYGKWKPSPEALRLGPLAVEAERLVRHDGRTVDEAAAILSSARNEPVTREDLSVLLANLPIRVPRRGMRELDPDSVEAPDPGPEEVVRAGDLRTKGRRVHACLTEAIDRLKPADRLLMKLYFVDGLTIARIAQVLGVEQRPMYRTRERCLKEMRTYLESQGVGSEAADEVVGSPEVLVEPVRF